MLIEGELCLSEFTAFLNNRQLPASDLFNELFTPKKLNNGEIIDRNIQLQLGAPFLSENWIYCMLNSKKKAAAFCNARPMSLLSSCLQNFTLQQNRMTAKLSTG